MEIRKKQYHIAPKIGINLTKRIQERYKTLMKKSKKAYVIVENYLLVILKTQYRLDIMSLQIDLPRSEFQQHIFCR